MPLQPPDYEPLNDNDMAETRPESAEDVGHVAPSAAVAAEDNATAPSQTGARTRDGVFANLTANPVAHSPHLPNRQQRQQGPSAYPGNAARPVQEQAEEKLPDYAEIHGERIPTYFETVIVAAVPDDRASMLVGGMEVGNLATYAVTAAISVIFGFFGFVLSHIMSDTHAGKAGAQTGLGITFIQYGITFYSRLGELIERAEREGMTEADAAAKYFGHSVAVYLVVFMGWLIVFNACASYIRALKVLAIQQASTAQV